MIHMPSHLLTDIADKTLVRVLQHLEIMIPDLRVSSFYRPQDKGVHGTMPVRAIDLVARIPKVAEAMATNVNDHWVYDPDRPNKRVAIAHDAGSGMHLHLQVHPNTRPKSLSPLN